MRRRLCRYMRGINEMKGICGGLMRYNLCKYMRGINEMQAV